MKRQLICIEMHKLPNELDGLEEGQIDWLYFGLLEKFRQQSGTITETENRVEFSALGE